jgi:hypothetical protein
MPGLNCHFVSRFLTRPWEYGQRQLSFFDFADGAVRSWSSRSLFAAAGVNSPGVETRLNQVIETPISGAIAELVVTQVGLEEFLQWPLFRALSLLLMLQPLRSSGLAEPAERLEETITRTDAELDDLTQAAQASYQPSARDNPRRVNALIRQMRDRSLQLIALCRERNEALDRLNAVYGLSPPAA